MLKKLYILGDSVTKGIVYENGKYSSIGESLYTDIKDEGVELKNLSHMGATADRIMRELDKIEKFDKDCFVVISVGGNDCDYDWKKISENPEGEFFSKNEPVLFENKLKMIIDGVKKRGAEKIFVTTLLPIDSLRYFKHISKLGDGDKIMLWLKSIDSLYRRQELYSEIAKSTAEKSGCEIIDLRSVMLTRRDFDSLLCEDGIHPTESTHVYISKMISSAVKSC